MLIFSFFFLSEVHRSLDIKSAQKSSCVMLNFLSNTAEVLLRNTDLYLSNQYTDLPLKLPQKSRCDDVNLFAGLQQKSLCVKLLAIV